MKKSATKTSKKAKSLEKGFQEIPLNMLVMADWNYKEFDDKVKQKKLVANIKANGQIENLITHENEKGEIVVTNGNHRYLALQELKIEKAMCYHSGKLTDKQAKKIAFVTNETKFKSDDTKLAELISEIQTEEGFEDVNPFDDKEMEKITKLLKNDDDNLEDDETPKKASKSKTVVSAGGEKYTTVKMELSPDLAQRFNNALARFNFVEGNEKPLDIILKLTEKYTNEEILEITGHSVRKKKATLRVK